MSFVIRDEVPPDDTVVVVRGGLAAADSLRRTAEVSDALHGFYGVSVTQRTQGWFDMQADKRAVQAAQTVQDDAKGDLDGCLGRVERAGGKISVAKTDIGPAGFFALVVDTEGNSVGLHVNRG